jgi:magnesium transporter
LALHADGRPLALTRLALLMARNVVVSIHDEPILGFEDPVSAMAHDPRFGRLDAGRFAGLLLEGVLGGYDEVIERLGREIDELDERALVRVPGEDLLEAIVDLRGRIAMLRRALAPQRAVFAALSTPVEDDPSPIGMPDASLLAHLERTVDAVERLREQLIGSFDILMTRTGQRTNDIVRVLTVVSAVLLPAVVIAGIMGMNFQPAFFDEPAYYFVVVAVMIGLAVATLVLARLKGWI